MEVVPALESWVNLAEDSVDPVTCYRCIVGDCLHRCQACAAAVEPSAVLELETVLPLLLGRCQDLGTYPKHK